MLRTTLCPQNLLIFLKDQILDLLIYFYFSIPISLISSVIFIISFFLLSLGLVLIFLIV